MDEVKDVPVFQLLATLLLGLDQNSARVTISPAPSVQIPRPRRSRAITQSSVLFLDRDIIESFSLLSSCNIRQAYLSHQTCFTSLFVVSAIILLTLRLFKY